MPTAIVLDKKLLFTGTVDPAVDTEINEALAAAGDLVYVPDQIIIPNTVDTAATGITVQITDASDVVQYTFVTAVDLGIGAFNFILDSSIEQHFTDSIGNEHAPLPKGMIIKGGWKLKTVSETLTSCDYGLFKVYGHMAKLL